MIYIWLVFEALLAIANGVIAFYFSIEIYERTRDSSLMAISVFLGIAPSIYISFIAGKFIDIFGKIKTIRTSCLALISCTVPLGFYTLNDNYNILLILIVIGIRSSISAFNTVSSMALIPELVSEEKLRFSLSIQEFINKGAIITSPIVAGIIYSKVSLCSVIFTTALIILICFILMGTFKEPINKAALKSPDIKLKWCITYLSNKLELKNSLIFFTTFNALNGVSSAFLVAYALMLFNKSQLTLATINLFIGSGAFIGSVVSIKKIKAKPLIIIAMSTAICAILGRIFLSFSSDLFIFSSLLAIRASLIPIGNICNQIIWIENTEPKHRASLFGFRRLIAQGFFPISILVIAYIVNAYNLNSNLEFLKSMFLISGILELTASIILVLLNFMPVKLQ